MEEFYERYRESEPGLVLIKNYDQTFPVHFHNNIEVLLCFDSCYEIMQSGKTKAAQGPFAAFTDSYAPHGYKRIKKGRKEDYSLLIPKEYQYRFRKMCGDKRPESSIIFGDELYNKCVLLIDTYYNEKQKNHIDAALGELILAIVFDSLSFKNSNAEYNDVAIVKMLSYIDEHYREPITLESIAAALGYRPEHLSRVFHKYLQTNIKTYINRQRVNAVAKQLENTNGKRIDEIAVENGFNSPQSYYRAKKM